MRSRRVDIGPSFPKIVPAAALAPLLFASLFAAGAAAAPPKYTVKLFAPPDGFEYAAPTFLSELGEIVGYAAPEPFHPISVPVHIDAAGEMKSLPGVDVEFNFAFGINDKGLIAGMSKLQAYAWKDGVGTPLRPPPGIFSGMARAVDGWGLIAGSVGDSDQIGPQHCVWTNLDAEAVIIQGVFPGNSTGTVFAVNERGQLAGVSGAIEGSFLAARWDNPDATPIAIGPLPGAFNSEARDLNERGDVIGRSSFEDFTTEAFIYVEKTGKLIGLGFLPGGEGYSEAFGINHERQVVGTARAAGGVVHAFLWQDGTMHDLNDLIVTCDSRIRYLSSAAAINDSGLIAAEAVVAEEGRDLPRWIALLTPVTAGITLREGPLSECEIRPGDCNGDGGVDISDAVCLLGFLFLGSPAALPCGKGTVTDQGNQELLSWDGGADLDISDAVALLGWAFLGGPPHVLGVECRPILGCPKACGI